MRETKSGAPAHITIDLKNGTGSITMGKIGNADATFVMLDEDFIKVIDGTLSGNEAFRTGKMKIKGSIEAALKFTPDIFPKDAKL